VKHIPGDIRLKLLIGLILSAWTLLIVTWPCIVGR